MKKGEILFYKNYEVELLELDYDFNLALIRYLKTNDVNYVSLKVISYTSKIENYISVCLLERKKIWY